jgi:hypothetical protein
MPNQTCDECHRLWQEYARATTDHVRLDNKLRLAALTHDPKAIQVLTHQIEGAEEQREWAREAIRKHEASGHAMADASQDAAAD